MLVRVGAALVATLLASGAQAGSPHEASAAQDAVSVSSPEIEKSVSGESGAPSDSVAMLLRWITASGDNKSLPFIVVDKLGAKISVFNSKGKLLGSAPALVGIGRGDDPPVVPGTARMGQIPVEQRNTPAGRFVARFGPAKGHPPVLWVDYANAIAVHPVVNKNKKERRLERIKSADADDHRISFGCINVPASFFAKTIKPQFKSKKGSSVVYVLPETKALTDVFPGIVLHAASGSRPEVAADGGV